jgi:hypothetical protein
MTVTVAAWLTWALSAIALLGFVVIAFVLIAARDEFMRQLRADPNFEQLDAPTDQIVAALWLLGAIALIWGVVAMVLAWFAYRRANWARITLVVSAGMTALFSLVAFPVGLLHTLGSIAVVALLFTGGANEWYARRGGQGFPGSFQAYGSGAFGQPYPGQPQPGPQQYGGQPGRPGQGYGEQPVQPGRPGQPYGEQPGHGYGEQPGQPPQHGQQAGPSEQPGQQQEPEAGAPEQGRGRGKDEPPSNVW